jgi:AAA+ superfamily predicted ATPase
MAQLQEAPNARNGVAPLFRPASSQVVVEVIPQWRMEDLILPKNAEEIVRDLIEEQNRADLLRSHGLEPRHRVLLAGPPGNGKTSLAEALADALNISMLVVRYESVIGELPWGNCSTVRAGIRTGPFEALCAVCFLMSLTHLERSVVIHTKRAK